MYIQEYSWVGWFGGVQSSNVAVTTSISSRNQRPIFHAKHGRKIICDDVVEKQTGAGEEGFLRFEII